MKKGIIVLIPILQMMETDEYHLYESVEEMLLGSCYCRKHKIAFKSKHSNI